MRLTKKLRIKKNILTTLSVLLNVGPLIYFTVLALISGSAAYTKVALCTSLLVVAILTAISWLNKIAFRSKLWIFLIGIYACLQFAFLPIIIIGSCQVIDQLIIGPLKAYYKQKYIINREIDARGI